MKSRHFLASVALGFCATNALALGAVSRACPFNQIPAAIQPEALLFFHAIGAARWEQLRFIALKPESEKRKYWMLESISTDYGNVRYYLFAESKVYRGHRLSDGRTPLRLEATYKSYWTSMRADPKVYTDSKLKIFFSNRGPLFSARAGHPDIIQYWNPVAPPGLVDYFHVLGHHYRYDPIVQREDRYAITELGNDCNLEDWGA